MIQLILLIGLVLFGLRLFALVIDLLLELLEIFFSKMGWIVILILLLLLLSQVSPEQITRFFGGFAP